MGALMLVLLHILLLNHFRKNNVRNGFWIFLLGGMIVPLLAVFFYLFSFSLIDSIIGPDASGYHGYPFIVFLFYPVFLAVYLVALFAVDWIIRRRCKA